MMDNMNFFNGGSGNETSTTVESVVIVLSMQGIFWWLSALSLCCAVSIHYCWSALHYKAVDYWTKDYILFCCGCEQCEFWKLWDVDGHKIWRLRLGVNASLVDENGVSGVSKMFVKLIIHHNGGCFAWTVYNGTAPWAKWTLVRNISYHL